MAGARENESPCHFNRRGRFIACVRNRYAELTRGLAIDGGVGKAGRGDELQARQPFEKPARERRALTHDADDLERRQSSGHSVWIVEVVVEDSDGRPSRQRRPVRHLQGDILIVIEDGDLNGRFSRRHLVPSLCNWESPTWMLPWCSKVAASSALIS